MVGSLLTQAMKCKKGIHYIKALPQLILHQSSYTPPTKMLQNYTKQHHKGKLEMCEEPKQIYKIIPSHNNCYITCMKFVCKCNNDKVVLKNS